ncbi:hypothetical protein CIB84_016064 [Bambusicola thoracicus]|uniref:Uncharacterized protein n=1 Tax=Bambusicola thoracicus TaxID=9083 RepID=A0A2P4S7V9_BAMTH|nr:hypothetical protein CIB84_016064 [Bambusicola thoracicus]
MSKNVLISSTISPHLNVCCSGNDLPASLHIKIDSSLVNNIFPTSYLTITSDTSALKFKILVKNKKCGTIEETMLRKGRDSHGETGEVSEEEITSSDEETDEKAPLYPKSGSSERKSEGRSSPPPRKKAKVKTYITAEFRKRIAPCQPFYEKKKYATSKWRLHLKYRL